MSQDYSKLEGQIGDMGAETPTSEGLGKLQHKASYGQKEDLDNKEEQSFEDFMKKSKKAHNKKIDQLNNDSPISQGWIPINREELGIRSIFYPTDWEFSIRPATVSAIKNWTAIDEENPAAVNKVFNEIIKSCVKIESKSIEQINWSKLNSWDRFWFILKVREYTFTKGESKVEFTDNCSECDEEMIYTLNSDSLFYEFPDDELIEKYWNGKEWVIDPREYNVDHDEITLYTPTLGKEEAIIDWARAKTQNKQKVDEVFIKYLLWLFKKPATDPIQLDRLIQKIYNEYKKWNLDMFTFIDDVINNITINPSEKLRCKCPSCGREATSNVQFPNGIKVLFEVKTNAKKFGSR